MGRLVGESVVVPISVLICFCLCFSALVVDSVAVVFGGCGFFFFFPGDCGRNNFSGCCCGCCCSGG